MAISTYSSGQFPSMRLTRAEKVKEYGSVENWARSVLEHILNSSGHGQDGPENDRFRMKVNYDLAAGKSNLDDLKSVTTPFGMSDFAFPAIPKHYDQITPKLNTLRGEEINRPFNFMVVSANPNDHTEVEKAERDKIHDSVLIKLKKQLQDRGVNINSPEGQAESQKTIKKAIGSEFSDMREQIGQAALEHLRRSEGIEAKFHRGWFDMLVSGMEVYWTGIVEGEPVIRLVNPLYFDYDRNEDTPYIEDSAWAIEWRYMSAPQVHDEFHSVLSDEDVKDIEDMKGHPKDRVTDTPGRLNMVYGTDVDTGRGGNIFSKYSNTIVKVVHCEFKSLRKVGFVTWTDPNTGKIQEKMVNEDFKIDEAKGEKVTWEWISETWECTKIGDNTIVYARPKPNQHKSIDNPSKCKLGYVGLVHNNRNSTNHSMVDTLKPHQAFYDIIMHRLELAIARAKGKGLIFDVAQIPKSKGINLERWLYYLDIMGIAFINSFEEGTGRFAGQASKFNQFKEFDLTISNTINQYVGILDKLESMISSISGVSPQREGNVSSRDLASTTKISIAESENVTAALVYSHTEVKKNALTSLLEESKIAWINGKKGSYVMPDLTRKFFDIDPDLFVDSDYNVFVSNSAKDGRTLELINKLAEVAIQSGQAHLKDLVNIAQTESISEAKWLLENGITEEQERLEGVADNAAKRAEALEQIKDGSKQKDRDAKDLLNIRDNETDLEIALIGKEAQDAGTEVKQNQVDVTAHSNSIKARVEEMKLSATRDQGMARFAA